MKTLGTQLIVELYGCNKKIIDDNKLVEKIMIEAAHAANATVVTQTFHKFSPQGVSGVVVIAESHLAIHTWPEHGYCAIDVYTCGNQTNNEAAVDLLVKNFEATQVNTTSIQRGFLNTDTNNVEPKPAIITS